MDIRWLEYTIPVLCENNFKFEAGVDVNKCLETVQLPIPRIINDVMVKDGEGGGDMNIFFFVYPISHGIFKLGIRFYSTGYS